MASEPSAAPPAPRSGGRKLLAGVLVLSVLAAAAAFTALGWFLNNQFGGPRIDINRPLNVTKNAPIAVGYVPNVYGIDEDSAIQALVDSGVSPARISTKTVAHVGDAGLVVTQSPTPGKRIGDAAVVLGLAGPATMPSLVGKSLDQAREQLEVLGASVKVEHAYRSGADEGTILATAPAAGGSVKSSVTLTVADPASSVFLSDLEAIQTTCSEGAATISGADFENSVTCAVSPESPASASYSLGRSADAFSATVGLDDEGDDSASVRFVVLRDRQQVQSFSLRFGQSRKINVPLKGALRLTIKVIGGGRSGSDLETTAVWGDARVSGGESAIDRLSATDDTT